MKAHQVLILTHPACVGHNPGAGHPERPQRLQAVIERLREPDFGDLVWREAPQATAEQVARAHPPAYVEAVLAAIPAEGLAMLDGDTIVSPGSGDAALRAAGAAVAAVDAVIGGEAAAAFCAVRPPGHHAEPDRAMGFCLFNNVVVGARHAMAAHGLKRVAVMDFDVHHGNGTETAAMADPRLFYASTHQVPLYPGTGMHNDPKHPNVVNVGLPPGAGSEAFRAGMSRTVLPALERFAPELVIISAGFDAHARDPLAELRLVEDDYAWATAELVEIAHRTASGRVVSALEGGYDLSALADCAAAHVRALMGPLRAVGAASSR
jgi:acetoin utilization deacetylase AcuC-like enzyme